ncbi:MAG: hypothetical protein KDH99_11605 [Alcanivoracaceae bacterium]|nr:hypothetical protein [Alcanivoracaceae bacterium]
MLKRYLMTLCLLCAAALAQATDRDQVETEMESLSEFALQQALEAIAEQGGLYPFAMIRNSDGKNALIHYKGEPDKAPPAEEYVKTLYKVVATTVRQSASSQVAVIVRQISVPTESGEAIPGIWVLVDHRLAQAPKVIFQPLVPGEEKGQLVPGTPVVQSTTDNLFPRMALPSAKK